MNPLLPSGFRSPNASEMISVNVCLAGVSVLLQVVDERRTQQRLLLAEAVPGQFAPQRDRLVDRRPDGVRRAVERLGLVRVRQVPEYRPEELQVVPPARLREG